MIWFLTEVSIISSMYTHEHIHTYIHMITYDRSLKCVGLKCASILAKKNVWKYSSLRPSSEILVWTIAKRQAIVVYVMFHTTREHYMTPFMNGCANQIIFRWMVLVKILVNNISIVIKYHMSVVKIIFIYQIQVYILYFCHPVIGNSYKHILRRGVQRFTHLV